MANRDRRQAPTLAAVSRVCWVLTDSNTAFIFMVGRQNPTISVKSKKSQSNSHFLPGTSVHSQRSRVSGYTRWRVDNHPPAATNHCLLSQFIHDNCSSERTVISHQIMCYSLCSIKYRSINITIHWVERWKVSGILLGGWYSNTLPQLHVDLIQSGPTVRAILNRPSFLIKFPSIPRAPLNTGQ